MSWFGSVPFKMLFLDYNIGYNTRGTVVHYSGLFYLHFSGGCISMNIIIRGIFFLGKKNPNMFHWQQFSKLSLCSRCCASEFGRIWWVEWSQAWYGSGIQFNMIYKDIVFFLNRGVIGKKKIVVKIFLIALWNNGDKLGLREWLEVSRIWC